MRRLAAWRHIVSPGSLAPASRLLAPAARRSSTKAGGDSADAHDLGYTHWTEVNADDKTIDTAVGALPVSPLLNPQWREARVRKTPKTSPDPHKLNRFQRKLRNNPYAQMLAEPVRSCHITRVRLPRYFIQTFGLVRHPESDALWWIPGDYGSEAAVAQPSGDEVGVEELLVDEIDGLKEPSTDEIDGVEEPSGDEIDGLKEPSAGETDGVKEPSTDEIDGVKELLVDEIDGFKEPSTDEIDGVEEPSVGETDGLKEPSAGETDGLKELLVDEIDGLKEPSMGETDGVEEPSTDEIDGLKEPPTDEINDIKEPPADVNDIAKDPPAAKGKFSAPAHVLAREDVFQDFFNPKSKHYFGHLRFPSLLNIGNAARSAVWRTDMGAVIADHMRAQVVERLLVAGTVSEQGSRKYLTKLDQVPDLAGLYRSHHPVCYLWVGDAAEPAPFETMDVQGVTESTLPVYNLQALLGPDNLARLASQHAVFEEAGGPMVLLRGKANIRLAKLLWKLQGYLTIRAPPELPESPE